MRKQNRIFAKFNNVNKNNWSSETEKEISVSPRLILVAMSLGNIE
jgi:hypothetical protein